MSLTVPSSLNSFDRCGEELVKLHYSGVRRLVKEREKKGFVCSFVDDLVAGDGALNWCEAPSGSYG
jgi:hypothetical protein